jgi:ribosomal protein L37AE/L43A
MHNAKFICPHCGKESQEDKYEDSKIVIYECALCGSLVAAYLKEYHDLLRGFFKRYKLNRFKPEHPSWVKSEARK